jgi:hypothetical protein
VTGIARLPYNLVVQTRTLAIALILAVALLDGCNKKTSSAKSGDAVEQKLQELAGSGASNCGRVKSAAQGDNKPASDCAMQAAQAKKPFYVAYELPGLTVAIAGASDGKLYAVQSQTVPPAEGQQAESKTAAPAEVTATPCPAELRIASSGRVTCYPAGSFGAMPGANPHGGAMMPPSGAENPHGGGMMMPPAGTANPHGGTASDALPSSHGSATKNANPPAKPASKQ